MRLCVIRKSELKNDLSNVFELKIVKIQLQLSNKEVYYNLSEKMQRLYFKKSNVNRNKKRIRESQN